MRHPVEHALFLFVFIRRLLQNVLIVNVNDKQQLTDINSIWRIDKLCTSYQLPSSAVIFPSRNKSDFLMHSFIPRVLDHPSCLLLTYLLCILNCCCTTHTPLLLGHQLPVLLFQFTYV